MNEIPKINFRKNSIYIKNIDNFFKNKEQSFLSINYSNEDILWLYLKDVLNNLNYINDIDYSVITSNNYTILEKKLNNKLNVDTKYENLLLLFKKIIDENVIFENKEIFIIIDNENIKDITSLFKRIESTNNIKILYLNKNLINADINIPSTFDLNEEKDIRTFLEKNCNIDRKKLIRIITNYVYNEIESSTNKIETINKYQLIFNDIENFLLNNLFNLNENKNVTNNLEENKKIMEEFENSKILEENEISNDDDIMIENKNKLIPIYLVMGLICIGVFTYIITL